MYSECTLCRCDFLHFCILEYKPRILCSKSPSNVFAFSQCHAYAIDTSIAVLIFFLSSPIYTAVLWKLCQNFTNKTSMKYERTVLKFGLFMRFAFDLRHSGRAVFEIMAQKATRFGFTGGYTHSNCFSRPTSLTARSKAVFLNRRALASIIPGRERFSWNLSF